MTTRIYIAAAYAHRGDAAALARQLEARGGSVVSTWHDVATADADPTDEEERRAIARVCGSEVAGCDVVVYLAHLGRPGGALWECGIAQGLGRAVVVVHDATCKRPIFDSLHMRVDLSLGGDMAERVAKVLGLVGTVEPLRPVEPDEPDEPPTAQIIDLFAALKSAMAKGAK